MPVRIRRAYEPPAADDGYRVLVDRLWPRGLTRAALALDAWLPSIAPSTDLRRWFGHDPERWDEFGVRYRAELSDPSRARILDDLADRARTGTVTLVYAARDEERNDARVVEDEIARRLG